MNNRHKQKGYTLIELLVALTIFIIVIAAPTGFFVTAIKGQQKALASQELYDNISYVLEYMSRSLRMARKDFAGSCIAMNTNYATTTDGHGIRFKNYDGKCQEFYLDSNDNCLKEIKDGITLPLTASSLEVISFDIRDQGWRQDDNQQPKVTLFLKTKGKRGSLPELQPIITIQTSISQRNLDITY